MVARKQSASIHTQKGRLGQPCTPKRRLWARKIDLGSLRFEIKFDARLQIE
jgi:hypothetical protein